MYECVECFLVENKKGGKQWYSHSRLRYLCTRGFPLMAAILTGLLPGLIMSLVLLSMPLFRQLAVPLRPVLPLSNENETSESIGSNEKKERKIMRKIKKRK